MKQKAARPIAHDKQERKPKYIGALMEKAKQRGQEHEIIYERKLAKERSQDEHLYSGKDKFITSAYKKKLAEQAKWIEEERLRELHEEKDDVTKKKDLTDFYFGLHKNVAFGGGEVESSKSKKKTRKETRQKMKTVCVTGGSGFIASWVVKFLLQRGYTVKASVRNPADPKKVEHLLALDGAKERLHLFKANLLEEGSFDSAVAGCDGVFHMASPFFHNVTDPQAELIDPAVNGTLNVLKSCAKSPSVKRVVLTSSIAAVAFNGKPRTADVVIDESWWSNPDLCRENRMWYVLSKTLAEDAAWKFAKEKGIDLIAINPFMVIGPLLQPTLNTSATYILNYVNGAETYQNGTSGWVNVKDVANAHILAFENPSANGRYCVVESVVHNSKIVQLLRELYPSMKLPEKCADDNPHAPEYKISNEKAKSLGLEFTPLKQSLKETVDSLIEKNFVNSYSVPK